MHIRLTLGVVLASMAPFVAHAAQKDTYVHPLSNPDASVTVIEFVDLQCPACKAAEEQINQPLLQQYGKDIRFEFRHFPLTSVHRYALHAGVAAECAGEQGKFWEYIAAVYEGQEDLGTATLRSWAKDLKLNIRTFAKCQRKKDIREHVLDGRNVKNVTGTPTYFVNGTKLEFSYESTPLEDLVRLIEKSK